mgnify:FL=1
MVWNETRSFGMGRSFFKSGQSGELECVLIVALYSPKGNGESTESFEKNVSLGVFKPTNCELLKNNKGLLLLNQQTVADVSLHPSTTNNTELYKASSLEKRLDKIIKVQEHWAKEKEKNSFIFAF